MQLLAGANERELRVWYFLFIGFTLKTHGIHVWHIYLHLVDFHGKCRWIYHTWILCENGGVSFWKQRCQPNKNSGPKNCRIITSVVPPSLPMQMAFAVNTALMSLMKLLGPDGFLWRDLVMHQGRCPIYSRLKIGRFGMISWFKFGSVLNWIFLLMDTYIYIYFLLKSW